MIGSISTLSRNRRAMPTVSKLTTLRPRPHVAYRVTQSGGLLVDIQTGACFQLNHIGADVWASVTTGRNVGDTAAAVRARYEVAADRVEADVIALCDAILAAGLADLGAQEPSGNSC
jgi:hypothetical protein